MTLVKAKIKNGDQLFIPNKGAKFQDLVHKPKTAEEEEKIPTSHPSKIKSTGTIPKPSEDETKEKETDGRTPQCSHGPNGKCLHCILVDKNNFMNVEYKCNHPKDQM